VVLGNSHETSDFIVDGLEKRYERFAARLHKNQLFDYHTLELYVDNGPAVASNRTQFINRLMEFTCVTSLKIHLLYYPPTIVNITRLSESGPRWKITGRGSPGDGTQLASVTKVINTIQNVAWKGITPLVIFIDKAYQKAGLFHKNL